MLQRQRVTKGTLKTEMRCRTVLAKNQCLAP